MAAPKRTVEERPSCVDCDGKSGGREEEKGRGMEGDNARLINESSDGG